MKITEKLKDVLKEEDLKELEDGIKKVIDEKVSEKTELLAEEKKNEVVEQVSRAAIELAEGKEEISTSELKEKILGDLDQVEPSVSAAWRQHDQEKKGA